MLPLLAKYLRVLSLGKYNTKLYFGNHHSSYSTITGGIITLIFAMIVVVASLSILYSTFNWNHYNITTSYSDIKLLNETLKFEHLIPSLLNF